MSNQTTLRDIRELISRSPRVNIDNPEWIIALMAMPPAPTTLRHNDRWLETRSQRLEDGATMYAVVSRGVDGALRVTAFEDPLEMNKEYMQLSEQILGRQRGARIRRMDAVHLLHRTVVNEHGAAFHVGGLDFDATTGTVWINLLELDDGGEPIPGTECGVANLDGWEIC